MARQRYAGYEAAREAGLLVDGCDIRFILCGPGFTFTPAAVFVDDGTLDEYDGSYTRHTAANVLTGYDSGSDEWRITCDNGDGDEFGTTVTAASDPPEQLVVILHVTDDTDSYILGSSDDGTINNGNGGPLGLTLPNDVAFFSGNAP